MYNNGHFIGSLSDHTHTSTYHALVRILGLWLYFLLVLANHNPVVYFLKHRTRSVLTSSHQYVRAGCWDGATPEALSHPEAQLPFAENKGKAFNLALLQKVHRAEAALEAARQPLPAFYGFAAAVELEGHDGSVEHASAASVVTLQDELDGFAMTTVKQQGSNSNGSNKEA